MNKVFDKNNDLSFLDQVISMAWADDISFDKIKAEMGINEAEVIKIMRQNLKQSSFKLWRKRVTGRASKHEKKLSLLKKEM